METGTLISLGIYFIAMIGIGVYAYRQNEDTSSGYLLGGRKLSAPVTALSAGTSDMSGWMLLGIPGAMYVSGASSLWIALGLCLGAWINYIIVAPRLRVYTELANDAITLPDYFENRFYDDSRSLRIIASVVIIVFFTLYTSSGIAAGGKLFESSFGFNYEVGLYITAGVVVCYTLFGGFMAVSLTDFVQGIIMFIALVMVPTVVIFELGGINNTLTILSETNENMLSLFVDAQTGAAVTFVGVVSLMSWGLGYFGQPHIIVRFMAISSIKEMPTARRIGMSWMIVSIFGAASTGIFGLAYMTSTGQALDDPETIFITLSQLLFHPLLGGFLLAAILAAIMSTISSQLLVTSSSLTRDVYVTFLDKDCSEHKQVVIGRICVALVAVVAIALAYNRDSNILTLVGNAWAGFGAAFGPLVLFSLLWKNMSRKAAIGGIVSGAVTVLVWIYAPLGENGGSIYPELYAIIPGFIVSSAVIVAVSLLFPEKDNKISSLFESFADKYASESKK
ncbi:MAG: SSS family solute:Na+ symporter [Granulosicoccus sp.]|jgi:SSS family solute:Na+ symporter